MLRIALLNSGARTTSARSALPGPGRHARLALLLLLAASCNSNGMSDEDRLSLYADSAFVHYEQGDLARAESQALRGLSIDDEHTGLNLMLGWILLRRDDRDNLLRAEQVFRRQVGEEEDDRSRLGLATALERLGGLYAEAARSVERGVTKTAADSVEQGAEELRQEASEHQQESLALYEGILSERPNHHKARNGAMRVSAALDNEAESLRHCALLVETVERDRSFWAQQLQTQSISPSDETELRKRISSQGALLVDAHLFAASVLHRLGRSGEALVEMDHVVELDPGLNEAYSLRAQVLAEEGRLSDAITDIDLYIARSDKPYEHADIRRAFELRMEWLQGLPPGAR